jgi:beta-aspartyl-peptidase (threonine type)
MAHKCDAALHFGMHSPLFPLCLLLTLCCTSCQVTDQEATAKQAAHDSKAPEWSLAIHGGAGHFDTEVLSDEQQAAYRTSLQAALEVGGSVLEQGGTAVDAVVATIEVLEDDSLFNAGRGAVLTYEGKHELDASIMDGSDRNCGAITGLSGYRHPISVARQVMTESEHVFFSGPGAAEFAATQGAEEAEEDWFMTRKAMVRFVNAMAQDTARVKFGTVGCVALDRAGHLAAGTSTGGMTYKRHGRIGDSPVIGAGTWADDRTCAISATGWGEYFIRTAVAHDIHARMLHGGADLQTAADATIMDEMGALGGDGGVVALDARGQPVFSMNTPGMFRGAFQAGGEPVVGLFATDAVQP